jgi:soluble P-type ATPase
MIIKIPGRETVEIKNVIFDYNGTIAIDGQLIEGVAKSINELSSDFNFHVITADTFGSVNNALKDVICTVIKISEQNQDQTKVEYLLKLGKETTLCVGNGRNDKLMLKESVVGIAVIQDEGTSTDTLMASDIICKSIMDVLEFLKKPDRLKATLRN